MEKLNTNKILLIDGTFSVAPPGFYQLVTIHCYFLTKSYTIAYILLTNKTEESYIKALEKCKFLLNIFPECVLVDFEKSLNNAIDFVFGKNVARGCYYHFIQSIWKKMQTLGLALQYKNEKKIRKEVKKIFSLAMIPKKFVYQEYIIIKKGC
jgi:hypothetical protein